LSFPGKRESNFGEAWLDARFRGHGKKMVDSLKAPSPAPLCNSAAIILDKIEI
jgi:hypothetical protein